MPSYKYPKKNRKHLPATIPAGFRCVPVNIPDDPEWYALFIGALDKLGSPTAWDYDPDTVDFRRQVSQKWYEVSAQVSAAIASGVDCEATTPTDPQDCTIINAVHPSIGYFPNHPTLSPGSGFPWPAPAWCTNCNLPGIGAPSDVLIRVDTAPFFTDLDDLLASGVPSWTLHFSGQGEVDIRFRQTLFGGFAWVFPDGNPLLGQAIELEYRDLSDFAGTELIELFIGILQGNLLATTIHTHEMTFSTSGSHTVTAWYFPKVQAAEWPPIGWGGGLDTIQLCGNSIVLEDAPLDYTLDCNAGIIRLLLDSNPVSQINLAECGVVGPTGPQGQPGATGAIGPQGEPGVDGEDAMETWHEIEYVFHSSLNPNVHWEIQSGTFVQGEGIVTQYLAQDQGFSVRLFGVPGMTLLRFGAKMLVSAGADGDWRIFMNVVEVSDTQTSIANGTVAGPEEHIVDQPIGYTFTDTAHYIQFQYLAQQVPAEEIVTLEQINLIVLGYPPRKKTGPVLSDTTIWPVNGDWKGFSHL